MHEEQPVWIAINGVRRIVLSCSPGAEEQLALGHLIAEGWVPDAASVRSLAVTDDDGRRGVNAELDPDALDVVEMVRRHQTLHGCGLRHVIDCDPFAIEPVTAPTTPMDAVPLLRALFEAAATHAPDGGVHAAAISDGSVLLRTAVDVARHCAVDRAIGSAIQERGSLDGLGLVCTARVSGAMALKAVRSRLGWVASRSIATSLAHEIATAYGLLLIERAGASRP